jgi:hypothetical protein
VLVTALTTTLGLIGPVWGNCLPGSFAVVSLVHHHGNCTGKSDSRLLFLESDGPLTIATVHGVVFHFFGAPNRRLDKNRN